MIYLNQKGKKKKMKKEEKAYRVSVTSTFTDGEYTNRQEIRSDS